MELPGWINDHASATRRIHTAFEDALDRLDELGREPDGREQEDLVGALCSMVAGHYLQAGIRIIRFQRSVGQAPSSGEGTPASRVTKHHLRQGLNYVAIHHHADKPKGC